MTSRQIVVVALAIALAVQTAALLFYGAITGWCFCGVDEVHTPPTPPPFAMRFFEAATLPGTSVLPGLMLPGLGLPCLFVYSLIGWLAALLLLMHAMVLVARLRIHPLRSQTARRRGIWLAGRDRVHARHMLLMGCILIGLGMAYGAGARHRWLAEAERVFAASMDAASTGRPFPPGVQFSMVGRRGGKDVYVNPEPRFVVDVDPHVSGDHFLDRFVVPYAYGGWVRFPSGERYELTVEDREGWSVYLWEEHMFRR